jgi:putative transposase
MHEFDADQNPRALENFLNPSIGSPARCDSTFKDGARWTYLHRAVDERGKTVESHLSRTRDIAAPKTFFRRALKRHGQRRTITPDGF